MQKKTKILGKNISIRLDSELFARVELLATEKGILISEAIREVIREGCNFQDEFRLMRNEMKIMRQVIEMLATKDDALENANTVARCIKKVSDDSTKEIIAEVNAAKDAVIKDNNE